MARSPKTPTRRRSKALVELFPHLGAAPEGPPGPNAAAETLKEMADAIHRAPTLAEGQKLQLGFIVGLLGPRSAYLAEYIHLRDRLEIAAVKGRNDPRIAAARPKEGPVGEAFAENKVVRDGDLVAVPLHGAAGPLGALVLISPRVEAPDALVEALAAQAAAAWEYARLREDTARREKDLQTALAGLKSMEKNREELLSNVSHDLKTPLTTPTTSTAIRYGPRERRRGDSNRSALRRRAARRGGVCDDDDWCEALRALDAKARRGDPCGRPPGGPGVTANHGPQRARSSSPDVTRLCIDYSRTSINFAAIQWIVSTKRMRGGSAGLHHDAVRARAVAEEVDAAEQVAGGDAGGREDEVACRVPGPPRGRAARSRRCPSSRRARGRLGVLDEAALHVAAEAAHRDGRQHALGRAAGAHDGVDARSRARSADRRRRGRRRRSAGCARPPRGSPRSAARGAGGRAR